MRAAHPLGFGRFGLAAYDEVFFAGISWKPGACSGLTVELGYLNQYSPNQSGRSPMNHIASLNFLFFAP